MRYRFSDFELDTDQMELRRKGVRLAVEPQVFALLSELVAARDRVLTKDEIIDRVWQGRIVSDSALSSRIKTARRVLGDDGTGQRWIRTIHGRGFRFVGETTEAGSDEAAAADSPKTRLAEVMARPMVGVFPFETDDAGPDEARFADGLAEDLIAELAAWRWFPVLSRHATCDLEARGQPLLARATALGARYAIAGRLRRQAGAVRLDLELVDAASGLRLWSARLDGDPRDLLGMQAQIAADVFARIAPELNAAERRQVARKPPADLTAWDLSMKALGVLYRPSPADFAEALAQLEVAARLDPAAALPWSLTALIRYEAALRGFVGGNLGSVSHHLSEMMVAALRAVDIDPNGWLGHALASCGALFSSSFGQARYHADRALDLNPSAGLAHQFSGCIYGFEGDLDAALAIQSQAFRIDPDYLHGDVVEADLGLWRFLKDDLDQARAHFERSLALNPDNVRARQRLAALFGHLGDAAAGRAELDRLAARGVRLTRAYLTASYPFQRREHFDRLAGGLGRAGLQLGLAGA